MHSLIRIQKLHRLKHDGILGPHYLVSLKRSTHLCPEWKLQNSDLGKISPACSGVDASGRTGFMPPCFQSTTPQRNHRISPFQPELHAATGTDEALLAKEWCSRKEYELTL